MALTRSGIVAHALDLLDEVGVEGLSMRRLADALQVQAPALYWHFSGKPALLDEMAEALVAGVADRIPVGGDYGEVLRSGAQEMRRALLSRRDGARVFAGTFVARANVLGLGEILVGSLRRAGFDDSVAPRAVFSLMYYVMGFVIEEQALAEKSRHCAGAHPLAGPLEAFFASSEGYPNIRASLPELLETHQDTRFDFGVDLVVNGLAALKS
ncbi:TetR/AcrR family transcriptional regulator C-terminal domain-containing protein [Mesorhizobium sp. J428]|uniref:TetR/AcrR family transcriptional regulator C-terminal domain-containing protein n=1 Tax=Mesorhizobium sp. J428 TaxID=2898440 RepID=UPI0021516FCB|nr:TetR/AcrR family transcriptional regulator C-terminal domain-containing protein [Mesorhizobium sp. J428]MCR5858948.1 TetR/AcrR family transcriptional regulator C-terminal domain-containing protein [Mesorhizobium sp. J428]